MTVLYIKKFVKKASEEIATYTKYVHLVLYAVVYLGWFLLAWGFGEGPIPFFRIITFGSLVNLSIGIIFWFLPSLIIKSKKKKGKNWSGLFTVLNLFLVRYVLRTILALLVVLCIFGSWFRWTESNTKTTLFKQVEAAAKKGDAISQLALAVFYTGGKEGVSKDYNKALYWCRLSADQGLSRAQEFLGVAYREGRGVPKNFEVANKLFMLSAKQGCERAYAALGSQYYNGNGVEKDLIEATKWYILAGEKGIQSSIQKLQELEKTLSTQEIALANKRAEDWRMNHVQ